MSVQAGKRGRAEKAEAKERVKNECLQSYRRGWQHGASHRPKDKRFEEHATREDIRRWYGRGYQDGYEAMCLAGVFAAELLAYDPYMSVLRLPPPADPPESIEASTEKEPAK